VTRETLPSRRPFTAPLPAEAATVAASDAGESTFRTRAPLAIFRTRPLSTVPGPTSTNVVTPSRASRSTDSCQRTVPETWRTRPSRQDEASRTGRASTLLTSGTAGSRKESAASSGRSRSCAGFMSAQWKGAETGQPDRALRPRGLAALGGAVHRAGVPRDHDLARCVHVGRRDDFSLRRLPARGLDRRQVEAEDRGHGPDPDRHRLLHVLAPAPDRSQGVGQAERIRGHERRVLAERVPGDPGRAARRGRRAAARRRRWRRGCGLCVGGELKLPLGALEAQA